MKGQIVTTESNKKGNKNGDTTDEQTPVVVLNINTSVIETMVTKAVSDLVKLEMGKLATVSHVKSQTEPLSDDLIALKEKVDHQSEDHEKIDARVHDVEQSLCPSKIEAQFTDLLRDRLSDGAIAEEFQRQFNEQHHLRVQKFIDSQPDCMVKRLWY